MASSNKDPEQSSPAFPRQWEEEELGQAAYERLLPEMMELPASQVMVVNLNLTESIATALGALPRVQAHRADLVRSCADCRFHWVDALEDYALALNYVRADYLTVTRPARCSPEDWTEARRVRRVLMHEWQTHAARGELPPPAFREVHRGKGYLELGTDLTVLSRTIRAHAASKGVAPPPEVERATVLAKLIFTAGGRPNPKSEEVARARNLQNRMFTLFVRSYNEARFSMAYARRDEGDVDSIIPSLYSARRSRSTASKRARSATVANANAAANANVSDPPVAPVVNETAAQASGEAAALDSEERARARVRAAGPFEDEAQSSPSSRSARGG